jgi:hypothetical protein
MKIFRIALGIALIALMVGGQAWADTIVDPLNQNFAGFPTIAYTQQDKTYSNFTDVGGNFLSIANPITNIKTVEFPAYDLHTITFNLNYARNPAFE